MSEATNIQEWASGVNRLQLAYLKYLRFRGYDVDQAQIESLRNEIRASVQFPEPLGYEVLELQDYLAFFDSLEANAGQATKATLYNRGPIKLRMRPERNHSRPHFHIEYKRQYSASYAVDTLELLAGVMPRKFEYPMLEWARDNQASLLATWNRLNAGEDIRELVVARDA
jgi:hypothetical protein